MKVIIISEGGKRFGFGHITRCLGILEAFRERQVEPLFLLNGDRSISEFLRGTRYRLFDWTKDLRRLKALVKGADIIVLDSYMADKNIYRSLSKLAKTALFIDDYKRIDYPAGIVMNSAVDAERINYPKGRGVTYLLGTEYVPLRKEFWNVRRRKTGKDVRKTLVTLGGMNRSIFLKRLMKRLRGAFPDISFLKLGTTGKLARPQDVRDIMLASDLCISGGGQTLYELARCGLPAIGISLAENQLSNLKGLVKEGFLTYAGHFEDGLVFDSISKNLASFLNRDTREKAGRIGQKIVDGQGSRRIVDILLKDAAGMVRIRKADRKDCHHIWRWRNDPRVRAVSFNKNEIKHEEHEAWFDQKLKSEDTRIYIGEDRDGERIGQARFDIDGNKKEAAVSASLNPEFFRKGLGSTLIRSATETFLKENPSIRRSTAEIFDDNIISKKAFMKAGYIFSKKVKNNHRNVSVFHYDKF